MEMKKFALGLAMALGFVNSAVRAEVKQEMVIEGLNNPCGVAIQPETGHVFIADSGALRVVRVVDGKIQDVIVEFAKDIYGKGPMYDVGPLGLAFIDKNTLIVGGGDLPDGQELLRIFKVPEAGAPAIKAADAVSSASLAESGEIKGEGNFYAIAIDGANVYVTCNGDDTKGWISKATLVDGKIEKYERFIATKEAVNVDAPVGITIEPTKKHLAVGQMGEINVPEDSLLTFYGTGDGKMRLNYPIKMHDIDALAYAPNGQLFALDFAWLDTTKGCLFQMVRAGDDKTPSVESKRLIDLDKPTAMVFDAQGTLYVTIIGTPAEGSTTPNGKLLKITGNEFTDPIK
jgi:hypothetical protein